MRIAGTAKLKGVNPDNGYNILDEVDDRFNVWVYDKTKWDANTQHAQVSISTKNVVGFTDYNDDATPVDMVRYTGTARGQG